MDKSQIPEINKDPKTQLNQFLQRLLARPVTKADVVFATVQAQAASVLGFQTTLKLVEDPSPGMGAEYAGEVCENKKDADQSAAAAALEALKTANPVLPAASEKKRSATQALDAQSTQGKAKKAKQDSASSSSQGTKGKSKGMPPFMQMMRTAMEQAAASGWAGKAGKMPPWDPSQFQELFWSMAGDWAGAQGNLSGAPGARSSENPRCELNTLLGKTLGRPPTKDDVVFTTEHMPDGSWCAKLTHTELPGFEGSCVHTGPACSNKKSAEQAAAVQALQALQGLQPTLKRARAASAPPASKPSKTAKAPGTFALQFAADYAELRDARTEPVPPESADSLGQEAAQSLDMWFGQVCLSCLTVVGRKSWPGHAGGMKHQKKFLSEPYRLLPDKIRTDTAPCQELLPSNLFYETGGWSALDGSGTALPVLTLGEMDYSFSLALAKLRPAGSPVVATSYLEEYDPNEEEVHPSDDAERATYSRRTLPGMNGMLQNNLDELQKHGAKIRHGVDATNLAGTLRTQDIGGKFNIIVFPFPRATLNRAPDPRNSRLLLKFFESVVKDGFLVEGGTVQMVMLGSQYEEWDVACMAAASGFSLVSRAALPPDFYQAREMSGKPWTPAGAELLCFRLS